MPCNLTDRITDAIDSLETDAALFHEIVQGDDQTTVNTENGPVNSAAKAIRLFVDRTDWGGPYIAGTTAGGTSYDQGSFIEHLNNIYVVELDFVSTDFATDLAAGDIKLAIETAPIIQLAIDAGAAAAISETNAALSADAAEDSADDADATLKDFETKYLGAKAGDPALDNEGNPLIIGAVYFNTTTNSLRVWLGSAWEEATSAPPTVTESIVVLTAGQTVLTGLTSTENAGVYVEGVRLSSDQYTIDSGTQITLDDEYPEDYEVAVVARDFQGTPEGQGASIATVWNFDTGITDADPGAGLFRFDNATQANATFIYANDVSDGGVDIAPVLLEYAVNSYIFVQDQNNITKWHLCKVTSDPIAGSGYVKIPIIVTDSANDLISGDNCGHVPFHTSINPILHAATHESGGSDEVDHDALLNYAIAQHRIINDAGTSATELWSASKIDSELTAILAGLKIKADVATSSFGEGNITLSGEQTLNGLLTSTNRVLVTDQTSGEENGIYVTAAGAWTRATDYDVDSEVNNGDIIHINNTGSDKHLFKYLLVTQDPITIDTTPLIFTEHQNINIASQSEVNAGTNATKCVSPKTLEDKTHGAFTGDILSANATLKALLQELETKLQNTTDATGMITGILTGGAVTINGGDNTKFDLAAGTGIIIDWSTPSVPTFTKISWIEQLAITVDDLGSELFTGLHIDSGGVLQQVGGALLSQSENKQNIQLDSLAHPNLTNIAEISVNGILAYQASSTIMDYIKVLGPVNTANTYSANSTDLSVQKSLGTTTLPWINKNNDLQNSAILANLSQSPLISAVTSKIYQDGIGGFTIVAGFTAIDPDQYDDGDGTLGVVPNNNWTIQRFQFFGQTNGTLVQYGQAVYSSSDAALSAIFTEAPVESPLTVGGTFVTALIVKKGATDLSDISQAIFIPIVSQTSAAGVPILTPAEIGVALSDEISDIEIGTAKITIRMPYAMSLTEVRASVNTAPTGSVITVDINEGGSTILSTKLTIDATEKTSITATSPPVISDVDLANDAELTFDIDGIGSTIAGKGLKIWLIGNKS